MTARHEAYKLALRDKKRYPVLAYGSAGTGKTFAAVEAAVEGLTSKQYRHIICIRPPVSFAFGGEPPALPGDENEKEAPWTRPIRQAMEELGINRNIQESWEKNGKLWFVSLAYVQGLSFHDSFIIIDEAENLEYQQLKVLTTRQGRYSKLALCGDIAQTSPYFKNSGLAELIDMSDCLGLNLHTIQFSLDDVVRSPECKEWIAAFEEWEQIKEGA